MSKLVNLVLSVMLLSVVLSGTAMAELSGNIAVGSNYMWRGVTQTNDTSAVSGGLDYSAGGLYAGTWTSNLSGEEYELDLYVGYGLTVGPVDLDAGFISYEYPVAEDNFREAYVNATVAGITLGVASTVSSADDSSAEFSKGDTYVSLITGVEVSDGLELGVAVGSYNFKNDEGADYKNYQVSLSKDAFTFAVDVTDMTDTASRVSVSWSKGFAL